MLRCPSILRQSAAVLAVQELQSTGGVLVASGVSTDVGQWAAVARLQGEGSRATSSVASAASLRVPQFHKMHDHATAAIKMRSMRLRQEGSTQQFDGSMEGVAMEDGNVVLLQVGALAGCTDCKAQSPETQPYASD